MAKIHINSKTNQFYYSLCISSAVNYNYLKYSALIMDPHPYVFVHC